LKKKKGIVACESDTKTKVGESGHDFAGPALDELRDAPAGETQKGRGQ